MKNTLRFALNFFRRPVQNASLFPSSSFASEAMLADIDFSAVSTIVELGPGTGVFTKGILKRCKSDAKILLIEIEEVYAKSLRQRFGGRAIVEGKSAHLLDALLEKHGLETVDLIVSGLPVSLPEGVHESFLRTVKRHTENGARFRFFTYNPLRMKRMYKGLQVRKVSFVLRNIPPLWVCGIN